MKFKKSITSDIFLHMFVDNELNQGIYHEDISSSKSLEETLNTIFFHDFLNGFPNAFFMFLNRLRNL